MRTLSAALLAVALGFSGLPALSQGLIDKGFVSGWNVMVDPNFGNGCLIQTVYQDLSVVRIGYDNRQKRSYFVVFNKAWGDIKEGQTYPITFDLDGKKFNATAHGFRLDRVPGAGVFFDDPNFVNSIAQKKGMKVYNPAGELVMAVDLTGSSKAIDYARKCQAQQGG